jgi:hypothetical protein
MEHGKGIAPWLPFASGDHLQPKRKSPILSGSGFLE